MMYFHQIYWHVWDINCKLWNRSKNSQGAFALKIFVPSLGTKILSFRIGPKV
ncbi:hypothetical protein LguiA_018678 [Lonicera macranthoides]